MMDHRLPSLVLRAAGLERWQRNEWEERAAQLGIHPLAVRLLVARGVEALDAQKRCVRPKLRDLRPPAAMADFEAAVALLADALARGTRVGVFGDYDVDGVTTAATLATYLESLGCQVVAKVARRDEGYGFGVTQARALRDAGVELVVTGDCGTSDHEALAWLKERNIKSVVIDHHQVPDAPPPADAFINPHRADCRFPFKGLCSAGVAFYLCAALRTEVGRRAARPDVPDPRSLLDLVALGTVCDMVPLVDENRVLVQKGLRIFHGRARPGLRALLTRAGVAMDVTIDEEHLGFRLGPRLNAPGRLGAADPSLALLRAAGDVEAESHAEHIEALNEQRKLLSQRAVAEALEQIRIDPCEGQRAALTVYSAEWVPGIAGLVANAVVEHHRRPVLVLAVDPQSGEARGSARSCGGVDVRRALASCGALLTRCGGHPQAAGVALPVESIVALAQAFDSAVRNQKGLEDDPVRVVHDGVLNIDEVDGKVVQAIADLGPYGVGFEAPRFVTEAIVEDRRVLRDKHLSLRVRQGKVVHEAIGFGQAERVPECGKAVTLLYSPQWNDFAGRRRLQLRFDGIWF